MNTIWEYLVQKMSWVQVQIIEKLVNLVEQTWISSIDINKLILVCNLIAKLIHFNLFRSWWWRSNSGWWGNWRRSCIFLA